MKPHHHHRQRRRAFTLVEMSLAMVLIMGLGLSLLIMLNNHLQFMGWAKRQSFIARETPRIANLLGRLLNQADHFFIYENPSALTDAAAAPALGGSAVKLFFNNPEGGVPREQHLVFIQGDNATQLRLLDAQDDSSWTVASGYPASADLEAVGLQSANFALDQGLLRVTLQGPGGEQVHFFGGTR